MAGRRLPIATWNCFAGRSASEPLTDPWRTPARRIGRAVRPLFVHGFPRQFGLFEVMALGSVEWMRRHLAIINALEVGRKHAGSDVLDVLDFGGAGGTLGRAIDLYGLARHYRVTVADVDAELLATTATRPPIVAVRRLLLDGDLPFDDAAYDIATSSDVFEHIPAPRRRHWVKELTRVSRLGQIHTVPCDGDAGRWQSREADARFQAWHIARFGVPEKWTAEHLVLDGPRVEELRELFSVDRLFPIVNVDVWTASMQARFLRRDPAARLAFAARYYAKLRRIADLAPFKNALIVTGSLADGQT